MSDPELMAGMIHAALNQQGSDVTLLFRLRQPGLFKARMDGFLANAQKVRTDAERSEGEYLGVPYVHLATPDRAVHVYSAYPSPELHVLVMRKRSDPRMGETTYRLTDIKRGEPDPALFQVPNSYKSNYKTEPPPSRD